MVKKRLNLRSVVAIAACLAVSIMFSNCSNKQPRIDMLSASVENSINIGVGTMEPKEGFKLVRLDFIVYDYGQLPTAPKSTSCSVVTYELAQYAHCYQNGVELTRISTQLSFSEDFKAGEKCKMMILFGVPDDGIFEGLSFKFNLEGLIANYDGEFTNNVK